MLFGHQAGWRSLVSDVVSKRDLAANCTYLIELGSVDLAEKAQSMSALCSFGSRRHSEFAQYRRDVMVDGSRRHEQPVGDFAVGQILGEQLKDLVLTCS